jgi:hypothetical protein
VKRRTNPPSKKWETWEAYGDLFRAVADGMGWSPKKLPSMMQKDAEKKNLPRCTYSQRSIEHYTAPPKKGKPVRKIRPYRREHIHQFLSERLKALGKIAEYAPRLAAIAPNPLAVQPPAREVAAKFKSKASIKIDLSHFSPELEPLELRLATLHNVSQLTHKVYHAISRFVEPYHYGDTWVLRNKKTKEVIKNRRMIEELGTGHPVSDPRPLSAIGISGDTDLEAIPTP